MLYEVLDNDKWREEGWVVFGTNSIMAALQYYLENDDSGNDYDIRIDDVQFCGDSVHPFDVSMALWIHWVDLGLDESAIRKFIKLRPHALGAFAKGVEINHEEWRQAKEIYYHLAGKYPEKEFYKAW